MAKGNAAGRDNFTAAQKFRLAKRVNYHCSICDAQTSAPKLNSDEAFGIGEAAHIKAAAPGGPRYDPAQTAEERRSSENGIWACANCAGIIDRDPNGYTVDELHRLKSDAESLARTRLGKTPAFAPVPKTASEISRAVQMFCFAEAQRREQLDPRFHVSVNWTSAGPQYQYRAKEPVSGRLIISGADASKHHQALHDFVSYGGSTTLEDITVSLEGSPIFAQSNVVSRKLEISSEELPAAVSIVLKPVSGYPVFLDFSGHVSRGLQGMRFTGAALGGLLNVVVTTEFGNKVSSLTLNFELKQWAQKPLMRLPNFDRMRETVQALGRRVEVEKRLTANGVEFDIGTGTVDASALFRGVRAFIDEVDVLRKLDVFFRLGLVMPLDLDDIFRDAGNISELLSIVDIHEAEDPKISFTLVPMEKGDYLADAVEQQRSCDFRIQQDVALQVLGRDYGPFEVEISCPSTVVSAVDEKKLVIGVPARLSLSPAPGKHWNSRCVGPVIGRPFRPS